MLIAMATIALLVDASGQSTPATPELILRNGHIVTVDASFSIAEAVAIAGGRFVAVGRSGDIARMAGPSTRVVDLPAGQWCPA